MMMINTRLNLGLGSPPCWLSLLPFLPRGFFSFYSFRLSFSILPSSDTFNGLKSFIFIVQVEGLCKKSIWAILLE